MSLPSTEEMEQRIRLLALNALLDAVRGLPEGGSAAQDLPSLSRLMQDPHDEAAAQGLSHLRM